MGEEHEKDNIASDSHARIRLLFHGLASRDHPPVNPGTLTRAHSLFSHKR